MFFKLPGFYASAGPGYPSGPTVVLPGSGTAPAPEPTSGHLGSAPSSLGIFALSPTVFIFPTVPRTGWKPTFAAGLMLSTALGQTTPVVNDSEWWTLAMDTSFLTPLPIGGGRNYGSRMSSGTCSGPPPDLGPALTFVSESPIWLLGFVPAFTFRPMVYRGPTARVETGGAGGVLFFVVLGFWVGAWDLCSLVIWRCGYVVMVYVGRLFHWRIRGL